MTSFSPPPPGQYDTPDNLLARRSLHQRFSTAERQWEQWVHDSIDLDGMVLEVACGTGPLWEHVRPDAAVVLTDRSTGMAAAAHATGLRTLACDATAIPFVDGCFDTVLAFQMLYHVPDINRALGEIVRVLQPGGTLYAATNGEIHMRDLDRLTGAPPVVLDFTLENGAEILARHFESVELTMYDDSLAITDSAAAIDYLRSYRELDDATIGAIVATIDDAIAREGHFPVRKSTGVFTARAEAPAR